MKYKLSAVFTALAITLTFCSCAFFGSGGSPTEPAEPAESTHGIFRTNPDDYTEYYTAISLDRAYNCLENEDQQLMYRNMKNVCEAVTDEATDGGYYLSEEITVDKQVDERDIFIAFSAFKYDNPGAFWVSDTFSTGRVNNTTVIHLNSYYPPDELTEKRRQFDDRVEKIISPLGGGNSSYELELYLHDYLIDNCSYDKSAADSIDNNGGGKSLGRYFESFSAYGAVVNGAAVCQGYTDALGYLLSCVGVESSQITGKSQGANHVWNTVLIDGEWYHVDSTWDDCVSEASTHDYFNITDDQIRSDHYIEKSFKEFSDEEITGGDTDLGHNFNIFIPECTSSDSNYYVKSGAVLQGFDRENDEKVAETLTAAASAGEEYFHIYIDPLYLDYDAAEEKLFDPYTYYYSVYVDMANQRLDDDCRLVTNAGIMEKKNLNVITVKITYEGEENEV